MGSILKLVCPECGDKVETSYVLLGAQTNCPRCQKAVRLIEYAGMVYPDTGYEISYSSFEQLLKVPNYRARLSDFLAQYLNLNVQEQYGVVAIRSEKGERIDLLALHLKIQGDPALQLSLYRLSMALWR